MLYIIGILLYVFIMGFPHWMSTNFHYIFSQTAGIVLATSGDSTQWRWATAYNSHGIGMKSTVILWVRAFAIDLWFRVSSEAVQLQEERSRAP